MTTFFGHAEGQQREVKWHLNRGNMKCVPRRGAGVAPGRQATGSNVFLQEDRTNEYILGDAFSV